MARASKKPAAKNTAVDEKVAEAAPVTTTVEPVQLTIADLQILSRIVDLASRRGAFQAAELSQVGESFNKLTGFLTYVESVQKKDAEAAAAEAAGATPEDSAAAVAAAAAANAAAEETSPEA